MTKVVLVDDHPLFRAGIRQSLATVSEFNVVAEAGNARDAFAVIDQHQPDLVVMDVSLPGMDGVIATREVRRRSPRTRVLVLSVHDQIGDVLDALDAGASGYALKTEGIDALVTALRRWCATSATSRPRSRRASTATSRGGRSRSTRCRFSRCVSERCFGWRPTAS